MSIQNIVTTMSNLEGRPAPYSDKAVEIKNQVSRSTFRSGSLRNFHINDITDARKGIAAFFYANYSHQESIVSQLRRLEPKIAPVTDDDPFI